VNEPYVVVFTAAARRALNRLPLAAATALYEHITGPVAGNSYRLGKQLDPPLDQLRSTRRGEYRALYTVDEGTRTGAVVAVAHRRDAYHSR
jgi:mRNA interferase RelE/StbE